MMQKKKFYEGIICGILTNAFWALGVLIPKILSDYSSMELTLGKYLAYGIFSLFMFFFVLKKKFRSYSPKLWIRASIYALIGNLIYFIGTVIGIKFSGATVTAIIIAILPISVAFYGNLVRREYPFSKLVLATILIFIGLVIMNIQSLQNMTPQTTRDYFIGIAGGLTAVVFWTVYSVSNANFLKKQDVPIEGWSTFIGINCLLWMIPLIPISICTGSVDLSKFTVYSPNLILFIIGSLTLGIVASWVATVLWNKTSILLPVALSGQLLVLTTVFALIFVYIYDMQFPTLAETIGALLTMVGVLEGVRSTTNYSKNKKAYSNF